MSHWISSSTTHLFTFLFLLFQEEKSGLWINFPSLQRTLSEFVVDLRYISIFFSASRLLLLEAHLSSLVPERPSVYRQPDTVYFSCPGPSLHSGAVQVPLLPVSGRPLLLWLPDVDSWVLLFLSRVFWLKQVVPQILSSDTKCFHPSFSDPLYCTFGLRSLRRDLLYVLSL